MRDIIVKKTHDVEHRSPAGALMAMTELRQSDKPISVTNFVADAAIEAGVAEEAGNRREEAEETKTRSKK